MSFDEQIAKVLGAAAVHGRASCDVYGLSDLQDLTGIHRARLGRIRFGGLAPSADEARRLQAAADILSSRGR